jgi:hypothetical protein
MTPKQERDGRAIGLVGLAAIAAGVAVAVLGHMPMPALRPLENVAIVTVSGLVIVLAGWVVAWAVLRRSD